MTHHRAVLTALVLLVISTVACGGTDSETEVFDPKTSVLSTLEFSSPAFDNGADIPVEYTCDGADISPPLRWSESPVGTRALAIIVDDPDAPGLIFRHWSVFNIPAGTRSLKESQPTTSELEKSILQGMNDFENVGYGGPCPPKGEEHEYMFFIYALSEPLVLEANAAPKQVSEAIRGLVIGTGSFTGMYARK